MSGLPLAGHQTELAISWMTGCDVTARQTPPGIELDISHQSLLLGRCTRNHHGQGVGKHGWSGTDGKAGGVWRHEATRAARWNVLGETSSPHAAHAPRYLTPPLSSSKPRELSNSAVYRCSGKFVALENNSHLQQYACALRAPLEISRCTAIFNLLENLSHHDRSV